MRTRTCLALLLACTCWLALAQSGLAQQAPAVPAGPATPSAGAALASLFLPAALTQAAPGDPVALNACSITVQCADGTSVSCNGSNSCSTSGTNNRCVTCDGVQQGCCAQTCCEQCDENLNQCVNSLGNSKLLCERMYDRCASNCGGCP